MRDDVAIYVQGLTKSYGRIQALRGVELEVKRSEIFGFLGPNGAGKTTTIRCLLDLIRPDSGTLRVLGIDPQKDPVAVRARVGYMPGELQFDERMTVKEALRLFNEMRRNKVDWNYVLKLSERLDLDINQKIKNLSKGNKQKVGIVQALMHRPELLILDEPTLGLDPLMQREVLALMREARADGATVFFSSHVMSEVEAIADRVGIIRQGRIVEVADTGELLRRKARRVWIRFEKAVDSKSLERIKGVRVLERSGGTELLLQVEGRMDALIKTLAEFPVLDLETERPTLEEVFLSYYVEEEG